MHTTIKVSIKVRDRLKVQAAQDGLTMVEYLSRLVMAEEKRREEAAGAGRDV